MTLLNFLQTHSLEEILENDNVVKEITHWLNNYWNPYLPEDGDNYDINVCIKYDCKYFIEDSDIYEFFGHDCNLLKQNYEKYIECDNPKDICYCPYKDEHKKVRMKDAKQILLKDLES